MTRKDIIRMAREAGWKDLPTVRLAFAGFYLERFFNAAYEAGAAAEREACAKMADHEADGEDPNCCVPVARRISTAIRARGTK
jgi:hypothetical protein